MTTSSLSSHLIVSASDFSYLQAFENHWATEYPCLNWGWLWSGENLEKQVIEDDCACADGRSQFIILIPPKDRETSTRDQK